MRSWNAWFNTQSRTLRHEELTIKSSPICPQDSARGASPSGCGQWASTLRQPANLGGGLHGREETQTYGQAP
jgi:hypothetical protein